VTQGATPTPESAQRDGPNGARATRAILLSAAAAQFSEAGYLGASLNEIVTAAGVTKGALYFHFPHKRAVAEAVIAEMTASWAAMVAGVRARDEDPLTALLAMIDLVVTALAVDPMARGGNRLLRDPVLRSSNTSDLASQQYDFAQAMTRAQLDSAASAGLLVPRLGVAQRAQLARTIVAMIAGHHLICDLTGGLTELWERITDMWLDLLPRIATEDWLQTWRAGDWPHRPRPDATWSVSDTPPTSTTSPPTG
jgi:AcrR family transcriptional regulator